MTKPSKVAGKQIDPGNSFYRNLKIATHGEFAVGPTNELPTLKPKIFKIVSTWEKVKAMRLDSNFSLLWEKRQAELLSILGDAIARKDPTPFREFAAAIEECSPNVCVKQPLHVAALETAAHLDLLQSRRRKKNEAVPEVTLKAFQQAVSLRYRNHIDTDVLRRICKQFGIQLAKDRVGRPRKNSDKSRSR